MWSLNIEIPTKILYITILYFPGIKKLFIWKMILKLQYIVFIQIGQNSSNSLWWWFLTYLFKIWPRLVWVAQVRGWTRSSRIFFSLDVKTTDHMNKNYKWFLIIYVDLRNKLTFAKNSPYVFVFLYCDFNIQSNLCVTTTTGTVKKVVVDQRCSLIGGF